MGKLGKKARKFAKKNLQSVMKRDRKFNTMFNKKKTSRGGNDVVEEQPGNASALSTTDRTLLGEDVEDFRLDILSSEDDDMVEDDSDIEEYLSEDPSCSYIGGNDDEIHSNDTSQGSELSAQNQKLHSELLEKNKPLEVLKKKDPNFAIFLQERIKVQNSLKTDDMSDEDDEMDDNDIKSVYGGFQSPDTGKTLNSSTLNSWCQIVKEQQKQSVLPSLLNAYRAACFYGAESADANASVSPSKILNPDTFCNIVTFMLSEGDNLFRGLLGISSSCKVGALLDLKTTSKWKNVKPMIKSYLSSSLFLLNQFTETDILVFSLTRLRASLIFFAAFPSLLRKLVEASIHLWTTGEGALSSSSFLILHDVSSLLGDEYYEKCLRKTYNAIISRCKVVDATSLKHIEYLIKSFVELCSIDMHISIEVATTSTKKLAGILQLGLQTKKEVDIEKICSWEYALCIELWVTFVSVHIRDNDLHGILFNIIQVINGVANLFATQSYMPLKIRCIRWLNCLSSSSEIFIPVSLFILDILESCIQENEKPGKDIVSLSTTLKLPKYWLKTRNFQEDCVFTILELLSAHFLQWSHHISLPELATIPIIRLKQFYEKSTVESLRRMVKRLIDQVEKNIEFVQRKRDEVSFSPNDQDSAESFLQNEKSSGNAPFVQYYKSTIENATTRKADSDNQKSPTQPKNQRQKKLKLPRKTMDMNGERESKKVSSSHSNGSVQGVKKKQKT